MVRALKWVIGAAVIQGGLLLLLAWLMDGFDLSSVRAAMLVGILGSALVVVLWPLLFWTATRFHPVLFPILSFLLTGLMILLIAQLIDVIDEGAMEVDGIWTGILIAIGLTVGQTILGVLFGLDDERMYDRFVTQQIRRNTRNNQQSSDPGVIFVEIDGLAEPVLRQAIAAGYMPTLQRWLESGTHQLQQWEPDLSSQTSASQAGILLGSNWGIPAFRWWDKPTGALMVSSKMATARTLEAQLSTGDGLLAHGGASRWNIFSGDATDCLGTFSRISRDESGGQRSYFAYLSSPYSLARTVTLFVTDVIREWVESTRQRVTNVQPRIHRGFKYSFIRAGTTVLLQEASKFMLTADMYRGVPAVYSTFFSYDEVAHHSGIDRLDTRKVLRTLDRVAAHFERVARDATRPYHLVILSDHGQSQGATFRQRYDKTLAQLVDELVAKPGGVSTLADGTEGLGNISAALTEAISNDSRTMRLVRRATRKQMHDGQIQLETEPEAGGAIAERVIQSSSAVVVASGNLGLVSFPHFTERMTTEQMAEEFPGLLAGLAGHEGISFVMARSAVDGGVVLGAEGVYYLSDGHVVGVNPLAPFGPHAAAHLARTDSFPNAPDVLVMSMFDPATGAVAAFEELVGCHGGLGGPQTQPFVLYPTELELDRSVPIVGAANLHAVLKSWVPQSTQRVEEHVPA